MGAPGSRTLPTPPASPHQLSPGSEEDEAHEGCSRENLGRIQFSVGYNFQESTLTVKIMKAQELPAKDFSGTSDPFVKIYLLPDKKHKLETKVKRKNLNPHWNETFLFEGEAGAAPARPPSRPTPVHTWPRAHMHMFGYALRSMPARACTRPHSTCLAQLTCCMCVSLGLGCGAEWGWPHSRRPRRKAGCSAQTQNSRGGGQEGREAPTGCRAGAAGAAIVWCEEHR